MAFMAMVFASIFLIVVVIGFFILLVGIILDIIWGVRKHKDKKVPVVLKVFALIFTIWGVIQGIGPIAVVGISALKKSIEYRAEISDIPENSIIHVKDDDDSFYQEFDLNGVHYIASRDDTQVIHPQISREEYKTEKVGAIVMENGKHYVLNRIKNDLDANIIEMGTRYDPYVEESKLEEINEYYLNKAPLFCEVSDSDKKIDTIDSDRIRNIVNYVQTNGSPYAPYDEEQERFDGYMIFYSYDAVYCISLEYKETDDGLCISYLGDYAYLNDDDAKYIRSLINY